MSRAFVYSAEYARFVGWAIWVTLSMLASNRIYQWHVNRTTDATD